MGWVTGAGLEVAYMTSTRFTFMAPGHASLTASRLENVGLEKKKKKRKRDLMYTLYCICHYCQIRSCYLQLICSDRATVFTQGRMWRRFYITDTPIIGNKTS